MHESGNDAMTINITTHLVITACMYVAISRPSWQMTQSLGLICLNTASMYIVQYVSILKMLAPN